MVHVWIPDKVDLAINRPLTAFGNLVSIWQGKLMVFAISVFCQRNRIHFPLESNNGQWNINRFVYFLTVQSYSPTAAWIRHELRCCSWNYVVVLGIALPATINLQQRFIAIAATFENMLIQSSYNWPSYEMFCEKRTNCLLLPENMNS